MMHTAPAVEGFFATGSKIRMAMGEGGNQGLGAEILDGTGGRGDERNALGIRSPKEDAAPTIPWPREMAAAKPCSLVDFALLSGGRTGTS